MNRIILLAALAAAPAFAPALAQDPAPARARAVVSHADLDLSRVEDRRTLDRRISHAVREVCGTASAADPKGRNAVRRCRVETTERVSAERGRAVAEAAERPSRVAQSTR